MGSLQTANHPWDYITRAEASISFHDVQSSILQLCALCSSVYGVRIVQVVVLSCASIDTVSAFSVD